MRTPAIHRVHMRASAVHDRGVQPMHSLLPAAPRAAGRYRKPQDVFDNMRRSFQPSKARGVHLVYVWKLSGPNGGTWHIKIDDGTCEIGTGTLPNADVTFRCSDETWVGLSNREIGGMRAFLTGKLHVDGSHATAKKLDEMFP